MSFLKRWIENYEHAMRSKVLIELKDLPQRHLDAAGISPAQLQLGVGAWPWRSAEMRSEVIKEVVDNAQPAANTNGTYAYTVRIARELGSAA